MIKLMIFDIKIFIVVINPNPNPNPKHIREKVKYLFSVNCHSQINSSSSSCQYLNSNHRANVPPRDHA